MPPLPSKRSRRYFSSRTSPTYCSSLVIVRIARNSERLILQFRTLALEQPPAIIGGSGSLVPIWLAPFALSELLVGPKPFQQFNTGDVLIRFRHYCNDVVAIRRVHQTEHSTIAPRGARNLTLLAPIR